jgi:hypothetical protein
MSDKQAWVVLNAKTQVIECLRCGAKEPLLGLQRWEVHLSHWKSFGRIHNGCKEPTADSGSGKWGDPFNER